MEKKIRVCESCGEKITGRSDKRFCSDYCRNTKHNEANKDSSNYTNVYETKKGMRYHFCYDQGYLKLEEGWYALVERQEYVK